MFLSYDLLCSSFQWLRVSFFYDMIVWEFTCFSLGWRISECGQEAFAYNNCRISGRCFEQDNCLSSRHNKKKITSTRSSSKRLHHFIHSTILKDKHPLLHGNCCQDRRCRSIIQRIGSRFIESSTSQCILLFSLWIQQRCFHQVEDNWYHILHPKDHCIV